MTQYSYGSHPELLPKSLGRGPETESSGVRELTLDESRRLEAASINRFPPASGGSLEWEDGSYLEQHFYEDEPDGARLVGGLVSSHAAPDSEVVLFWGNLIMPTVALPASSLVRHMDEVLEVGPVFWVFFPESHVLIECCPDGQVTVAAVPAA
ncbi:hypothetical protein ABZW18_24675 [Streptomyces sp. NPDC004647]|uniref:hypothetical protein n=1 Tax=Streptomyces sp. NPDC004647 TaxID=3154671 RepID=UPI0033AE59EF